MASLDDERNGTLYGMQLPQMQRRLCARRDRLRLQFQADSLKDTCDSATFARHGDVALCPKDARSSFITFLRSGDHDDETVKQAAVAMRHTSQMQASATYDKGSSDKAVAAVMKVAGDFSAKFKASSSTDAA